MNITFTSGPKMQFLHVRKRPHYASWEIPRVISKMADIIFQVLAGILEIVMIFFPKRMPPNKKKSWVREMVSAAKNELTFSVPTPIPPDIESMDEAIPKNMASFASISLEWSRSEEMGSFMI